jgi:hypothetical protein
MDDIRNLHCGQDRASRRIEMHFNRAVVDVVLVRLSHVFSDSSVYCSGGVSVQTDVNSWMDRSTEFN